MPVPMPPQLEAALNHLASALEKVEGRKVDLLKEAWPAVEKGVVKLLGGPFKMQSADHQVVALGLAAAFAARLATDHGAFWFPSRDSAEGASLGFPEALIMLSPFGAVVDALAAAKLERLDEVAKDIRGSLAKVKFGAAGGQPMRLSPEDYLRLFDPGFVQFVGLDPQKTKQTWDTPPDKLARDLRDALGRAAKLPPEAKQQLEQQLVGALGRLEPGKPLLQQLARAPRAVELMGLLFASSGSTGSAPEEFWVEVALPLLFVGAPDAFPELDDDELAAAKQGVDPFFLFLDVVPFKYQAADEGLLGAFPAASISLPDPAFAAVQPAHLVKVGLEVVKEPLAKFDAQKTREAIKRFGEQVKQKTGPVTAQGEAEARQLLESALVLLTDLKKLADAKGEVFVRRLTEAEASSEPALSLVRQALQGPRIILTA